MGIKLGNDRFDEIYYGTSPVSEVYQGSTKVWSRLPTPEITECGNVALLWTAVENASGYECKIVSSAYGTKIYGSPYLFFSFDGAEHIGRGDLVSVRAISSDARYGNSDWSKKVVYDYHSMYFDNVGDAEITEIHLTVMAENGEQTLSSYGSSRIEGIPPDSTIKNVTFCTETYCTVNFVRLGTTSAEDWQITYINSTYTATPPIDYKIDRSFTMYLSIEKWSVE